MKTKSFIAGMLLVATMPVRAATNDLTSALKKGLFEEEANHNLDAAAQAYQAVSAQFDKDRKLAATAIFRLGEVYRKQGRTNEATAQYERIVRDFSDQQTLVTLSRQNLSGRGTKPEAPVSPALSQAARLEQKRLLEEEIKLTEQDLTDVKKRIETGQASQHELRDKERELLQLRRQLAGLDIDTGETMSGQSPPVTDDEEKEIRRIQEMIKNSPDLINAKGADGETPLASAAARGQLKVVQFLLDHGADIQGQSSALNLAAFNGHKAMVELLLEHGADVNARDSSGRAPIHLAAENGFQSVVEALLARKADVNAQTKKQESPLFLAATKGHSAMVDLLIAKSAQVDVRDAKGWTALTAAAIQGHALVVKHLLDARADPNIVDASGRTALSYAVQRGNTDVVKALLEGKADPNAGSADSPLLLAVRADSAVLAEPLLRADADPNQATDCETVTMTQSGFAGFGSSPKQRLTDSQRRSKRTPLQAAVLEEHPAMAKLLLQFKGDAKAKSESGSPLVLDALNNAEILKAMLEAGADANARSESGFPALIFAAGNGNSMAVGLLVKHGAEVNVRDDQGRTPLYLSADRNETNSAELLLNAKADANAATTGSFLTALHRAVYNGSGEIAEMLLAHGANPNLKDNTGNTPLHWALGIGGRGIGSAKMVELLLSKGADPNLRNNDGQTALDLAKGVNGPPAPGSVGIGLLPQPSIPTRALRQPGVSESPAKTKPADVATLLREHGALDDLPDFRSIRLTRGTLTPMTIFSKDANAANRFTLFEVLESHYARAANSGTFSDHLNAILIAPNYDPLRFPDLTRIRIHRAPASKPKERQELTVNLLGANHSIDCGKDVLLEFGDLIEIPEREHTLAEPEVGLTDSQRGELAKCTDRRVRFVVRGEAAEITVHVSRAYLSPVLNDPQVRTILRSSSDLSHLKVKRTDPNSGKPREILIDAQKSKGADDLWLRDGDVIEVPDKP